MRPAVPSGNLWQEQPIIQIQEGHAMLRTKILTMSFVIGFMLSVGRLLAGEPIVVPLWAGGAPGSEAHRDNPERPVPGHEAEGWISRIHNPSLTVYLPAGRQGDRRGGGRRSGGDTAFSPSSTRDPSRRVAGRTWHRRLRAEVSSLSAGGLAVPARAMRLPTASGPCGSCGAGPTNGTCDPTASASSASPPAAISRWPSSSESDSGDAAADDPIDRASSRPDFQVPIYPGGVDRGHGPGHRRHTADALDLRRRRPRRHRDRSAQPILGIEESRRAGRAAHLRQRRPRLRHPARATEGRQPLARPGRRLDARRRQARLSNLEESGVPHHGR